MTSGPHARERSPVRICHRLTCGKASQQREGPADDGRLSTSPNHHGPFPLKNPDQMLANLPKAGPP
jgi:hypothetical protein